MRTIEYAADRQGVVTITFDRDGKRNAFDETMAREVLLGLEQACKDDARVLVLRAHPGVKTWCAGHDLSELDPQALHIDNAMMQLFNRMRTVPYPVVALVEGAVYAGGLILVACADLAIATPNAPIAMTANRMGIPLTAELYAYWLRVTGLHRIKELFFTAAPMEADEAQRIGIYNRVVPQEQLDAAASDWIERMLACSPAGIANSKRQLNAIASQTGLVAEELRRLEEDSHTLLHSPATRGRIDALRQSLRSPQDR